MHTYLREIVGEHLTHWMNRNPHEATAIICNAVRTATAHDEGDDGVVAPPRQEG
ncbi:hypothetical protein [Streptomyces sp. NPDC060035]|uniref:hypothetical protein n=1 Tax=Streptomyces sp. NPDC060035 TaxID=3347044 RepID=UPI00367C6B06